MMKSIPMVWKLLQDKRVAFKNKAIFIGTSLLYFLIPYDLIPDFPIIGHIDDFFIFLFLINWFLKQIPSNVLEDYNLKDQD
jgi:uncharacterized membrane protein YkvA (DUF1232 family)